MNPVPIRLRLSRARGFNLQTHSLATNGLPAVVVTRATEWGNPFRIESGKEVKSANPIWLVNTPGGSFCWIMESLEAAHQRAVEGFEVWLMLPRQERFRQRASIALAGHNLACACKEGLACHADVLLRIANAPQPEPATGADHG